MIPTSPSAFEVLFPRLTIFPLRPIPCDCAKGPACPATGKHPALLWAQMGPGEKLRGPDGHGIATGRRSGVLVVDIDSPEAWARWAELSALHGPMPETLTVATPRGWHLYYAFPIGIPRIRNSASELAKGIDIRGDGGFVVAPGSPHASGKTYAIVRDVPVAGAPNWLLEWPGLRARRKAPSKGPDASALEASLGARVPRAWRVERARAWLSTRPPAIAGQGGQRTTWSTVLYATKSCCLTDVAMADDATSEWNARCSPPWEGSEWTRTLDRAIASTAVPWSTGLDLAYAWWRTNK